MKTIFSLLFLISLSCAMSILTLINGWDLHPKSWGWIIGMGIFGQLFIQVLIRVMEDWE
jgi:hypothetical protein